MEADLDSGENSSKVINASSRRKRITLHLLLAVP
jgi:hypothetical protein